MARKAEPAFAVGVNYGTNSVRRAGGRYHRRPGDCRPRFTIIPAARPESSWTRATRTLPGKTRPTISRVFSAPSAGDRRGG